MIVEPSQPIYSISELNSKARLLLENELGTVWIMGELSNLATPSSGHLYFTLKDHDAQVRCAFFRANRARITFVPENGQQVLARANVSLYEARGDYQLIITEMQLAGSGALQVAFEKLKQKLQAEGLFDSARKKSIPQFPRTIGVITSPTGAAIHDILKVLRYRNPSVPVIIYPTMVQGADAKTQLVHALELANQRNECDVIILARGGGSLEDLWPFNEEVVARAIAASNIPIVSGVGHEVDVTIADFVADFRAPTPSAAAETVSTDQNDIRQKLAYFSTYLNRHMQYLLQTYQHHLAQLKTRLRHPGDRLREQAQRLDRLEQQIVFAMRTQLAKKQDALSSLAQQLNALSPLNTLQRGYAIITNEPGDLIQSVHSVKKDEKIHLRLSDGVIIVSVVDNYQP